MIMVFVLSLQAGVAGPLMSSLFILWVQSFFGETASDRSEAAIRVANLNLSSQIADFFGFILASLTIDKFSRFLFLIPGLILFLARFQEHLVAISLTRRRTCLTIFIWDSGQ
eukprot:TRINITY_DN11016_c0_g1_i1.p1 TRINITY_DN11016_c0_g1~~TRINITY_DN11016_c0_g1_i1.p1  ORF type:complete len:112 (-),score=12.25 TRINITY_DN11016_c0_g1_i1:214-549(-)